MKMGTTAQVYCNDKLARLTDTEIIAGHRTKCQTPEVLRQAIHERKSKSNLHENVITELFLIMRIWQAALGKSIGGSIRLFAFLRHILPTRTS